MAKIQKITPCLWFDNNGEQAARFYCSIFPNSRIVHTSYYDKGRPMPEGTVMTVTFTLDGQEFMALNGGPMFQFTDAISLIVNCETQFEIDHYWSKLSAGGKEVQCGWLKDKFGLSWQITPIALGELMRVGTPEQATRVLDVVMQSVKLDVASLQRAFDEGK